MIQADHLLQMGYFDKYNLHDQTMKKCLLLSVWHETVAMKGRSIGIMAT